MPCLGELINLIVEPEWKNALRKCFDKKTGRLIANFRPPHRIPLREFINELKQIEKEMMRT